MKKITPFLWFEKDIDAIIDYYKSIFPEVTTSSDHAIEGTPSGTVQTKSIFIYGTQLDIMTAGPYLPFNPTVSFIISCETPSEADDLWNKIITEGKALMPLDSYDFAKKFGWAQDKYGVSWQVLCMDGEQPKEKIIPTLMFCGDVCGRAEEAMNFYTSVFKNSHIDYVSHYEGGEEVVTDSRAKTKHAGFVLDEVRFSVLDSGRVSPLTFNQAISFIVNCENQEEVDYYWDKLTDGGKEVQCGWLSDKFGVPWQVVPTILAKLLSDPDRAKADRVTQAMMKSKKLNIKDLEDAARG